jgi:hypothetical protein
VAEENYGWLFVDVIPLLYSEKRVAKQLKIETWLDLYQLVKELGVGKTENHAANDAIDYVT